MSDAPTGGPEKRIVTIGGTPRKLVITEEMEAGEPCMVLHFKGGGSIPTIEQMTSGLLKYALDEGLFGESPSFAEPGQPIDHNKFVGLVVVRGDVVKPRVVQVATRYEID